MPPLPAPFTELRRRLRALPDGPIRELAAARALAALSPEDAAECLEAALFLARRGTPAEASVSWALCQAIHRGGGLPVEGAGGVGRRAEADALGLQPEQLARIYEVARERRLLAAALLLAPLPLRTAPEGNPSALGAGELSLGHRRALARTLAPSLVDRLAAGADAGVVRELLRNPRLTEREVLRIATRRPARQDVLLAIAASRWSQRTQVKVALARNPYSPPSLALRLVAHLPGAALREMATDGTLHPELRRLASALVSVERSPPIGGFGLSASTRRSAEPPSSAAEVPLEPVGGGSDPARREDDGEGDGEDGEVGPGERR